MDNSTSNPEIKTNQQERVGNENTHQSHTHDKLEENEKSVEKDISQDKNETTNKIPRENSSNSEVLAQNHTQSGIKESHNSYNDKINRI